MGEPSWCAAVDEGQEGQLTMMPRITILPQLLLELILIQGTDEQDKKALRQTCKSFQQMLDDSLVCTKVRCEDLHHLQHWFQHTPNLRSLHAVVSPTWCFNYGSICKQLPAALTTIKFECLNSAVRAIDIKELGRLPRLTSLSISSLGRVWFLGMENISGLTRLHCDNQVGSLAHLAPTLKHLSIHDLNHVQDLDALTNLELLKLTCHLPRDFFQMHSQLSVKHMWFSTGNDTYFLDRFAALRSAPTTLTRLTLEGSDAMASLTVLPKSITHLQLLNASEDKIQLASRTLSWLRSLDISMYMYRCESALCHTRELPNLQSLGISIQKGNAMFMGREQAMSTIPSMAGAVDRGIMLNVYAGPDELLGDASGPIFNPTWVTHV